MPGDRREAKSFLLMWWHHLTKYYNPSCICLICFKIFLYETIFKIGWRIPEIFGNHRIPCMSTIHIVAQMHTDVSSCRQNSPLWIQCRCFELPTNHPDAGCPSLSTAFVINQAAYVARTTGAKWSALFSAVRYLGGIWWIWNFKEARSCSYCTDFNKREAEISKIPENI